VLTAGYIISRNLFIFFIGTGIAIEAYLKFQSKRALKFAKEYVAKGHDLK